MSSAKRHIRLVEPDKAPSPEAPPRGSGAGERPSPMTRSGSRSDLEAAFSRYAPYVAAVGLRIIGRRDEVDDLVQDVFVAAAGGLGRIRDPRATKAWLATVTVRIAKKKLRRRRLMVVLSLDTELDYLDVADRGASPEQRAMLSSVYRVLDRLPADDRIAWTLRHVEGEKLEHVALLCDCSLATAKRRIARAHTAIRKAVGDG